MFDFSSIHTNIASPDKDFRYMGCSDLYSELERENSVEGKEKLFFLTDFRRDRKKQELLVDRLLYLIKDVHGTVREIAVKCLGPLLCYLDINSLVQILTTLSQYFLDSDRKISDDNLTVEELRDSAVMGLTAFFRFLDVSILVSPLVNAIQSFVGDLLVSLRQQPPLQISGESSASFNKKTRSFSELKIASLDILSTIVLHIGESSLPDPTKTTTSAIDSVLTQLHSQRSVIRKRATQTVGVLSQYADPSSFSKLVNDLESSMERIFSTLNEESNSSLVSPSELLRAQVLCVHSIANSICVSQDRWETLLSTFLPRLIVYLQGADEECDDLRETLLQTLGSFVSNASSTIVAKQLSSLTSVCILFLKYDPNYLEDEDMETDQIPDIEMSDPGDGDDDDDDDDDYEDEYDEYEDEYDENDTSWKVRKAAAKTLSAIANASWLVESIESQWKSVVEAVILRLSDRDFNVRLYIFGTFSALLKLALSPITRQHLEELLPRVFPLLLYQVKACGGKSAVITPSLRPTIFSIFSDLIPMAQTTTLSPYFDQIVSSTLILLCDQSTPFGFKIELLTFSRQIFSIVTEEPSLASPLFFEKLLPSFIEHCAVSSNDSYYQVASECFRLLGDIILCLRTLFDGSFITEDTRNTLLLNLYRNSLLPQFQASDVDQEVKETFLVDIGLFLALFGSLLGSPEIKEVFSALKERLESDLTRFPALRAFRRVVSSKLNIEDLSSFFNTITSFLRKNNRQLVVQALGALSDIVTHYSAEKIVINTSSLIDDCEALLRQRDLQTSGSTLQLVSLLLERFPALYEVMMKKLFPHLTTLLESPFLLGFPLNATASLVKVMVTVETPSLGFWPLFSALLQLGQEIGLKSSQEQSRTGAEITIPKQVFTNISHCIGVAVAATQPEQQKEAVTLLFKEKIEDTVDSIFRLLCIGEIGRALNLDELFGNDLMNFYDSLITVTGYTSEAFRNSISSSLGCITYGSLNILYPQLLQRLENNRTSYLLLCSLKEVILKVTTEEKKEKISMLSPHLDHTLSILLSHLDKDEETPRYVVSECIGRLSHVAPESILALLASQRTRPNVTPAAKGTLLGVLRIVVGELDRIPALSTGLLQEEVKSYIEFLHDDDLMVRKMAVLMATSFVHTHPAFLADSLASSLPSFFKDVFKLAEIDKRYIRTIQLGPFKDEVDDAKDCRKASFDLLLLILGSPLATSPGFPMFGDFSVFSRLLLGLSDDFDIKMGCHQLLNRISNSHGQTLLQESNLNPLLTKLQALLHPEKDGPIHEAERLEDLQRSTLRSVKALTAISTAKNSGVLKKFITNNILNDLCLKGFYQEISEN